MNTYTVTQIADAAKNDPEEIQKARELAYRLTYGVIYGTSWAAYKHGAKTPIA